MYRGPQIGLDSFCARRLVPLPHLCHHVGMDTSTTPSISPVLEPETAMALMLRYALSHEEVAHQYAQALIYHLTADVTPCRAIQLARDIITETTNDIRDFEGEEVSDRLDVALRRLINRIAADEVFMTWLAD